MHNEVGGDVMEVSPCGNEYGSEKKTTGNKLLDEDLPGGSLMCKKLQ